MAPLSRLRESVTQLHEQLSSAQSLDESDRQSLEVLLGDVVRVLDEEDESGDEPLVEQLRDAAQGFESSHPALTHAVGIVADALSRLGI